MSYRSSNRELNYKFKFIQMQEQEAVKLKQRLSDRLTQIVRERDPYLNSGGHFLVREYIRESLGQWGKVQVHEFKFNGKTHQNLILDLPGANRADLAPILIGAHYDTVPGTPGADDNATGVAVLLEMAQVFATNPLKHPVRLVAFDLEEYGLLGSTAYAKYLKDNKQKLRLMLSLEMLGYCDNKRGSQTYPDLIKPFYSDRANFIALVGNLSALNDMLRLRKQMQKLGTPIEVLPDPSAGKLVPITGFSDHRPFWQQKYRAIMVTDTAMLRNPNYHQASDAIASLDLDFLTNTCHSLIAALRTISRAEKFTERTYKMENQNIESIKTIFQSRLTTLEHLLKSAQTHFNGSESFLQKRIAPDMLPLGTQIAFTCNQPRNFALWCKGKPTDNLDPEVTSLVQAREHIANTKELVSNINIEGIKPDEVTRIDIGEGLYVELTSSTYVNEFLMPNFYFHLVTAYDILRMAGVSIGKRDYMMHLAPFVKKA